MSLLGDTWDDPRTLGLLAAAQAMMQQRGVGGLLSGATVYGGALAQAKQAERKRQMEDEQRAAMAEDRAMRQQVQQLQFEDAARRRAAEEAMAKRGAMDEEVLRRTFAPMTGTTANAGTGLIGPTNEAAAAIGQAPRFDPRSVLAMGGSFDALGKAMKINETMNPAPKLMSVAPGASVLDERNPGRGPVFTAPDKPPELPTSVREFQFSQQTPGFDAWDLMRRQSGASRVTVNTPFETEFNKAQGKEFSDLLGNINKAAFTAPSQLAKLQRMEQLLKGVDGGKLHPAGLEVASAMNSLGLKVDPKLGNKEAAESLSRELAGNLRQPGTGQMTDKDFENFMRQVPSLSKTAEGRAQIMTTMRQALQRDINVAQRAREYQRRTGKIDNGFLDELAGYLAENPVVRPSGGFDFSKADAIINGGR